jgi:DNA (cytosine-5)-methyltransferase 1
MSSYYNDFDPFLAEWTRELIAKGLIPDGEVDTRSIRDVQPEDLKGFDHVHLFSGIGGFAYALRLAHWPDDEPIWTGGFPCQPFSEAGDQRGADDDRHLWPEFDRLIAGGRPPIVLAENVPPIVRLALDGVLADLERHNYTSRAALVPACGVNAPTRRERLWLCALSNDCGERWSRRQDAAEGNFFDRAEARWREGAGRRPLCLDAAEGPWDGSLVFLGPDNNRRRAPAGILPLGDGFPTSLEQVRAYGNAIVPQVAAELIRNLMKVLP